MFLSLFLLQDHPHLSPPLKLSVSVHLQSSTLSASSNRSPPTPVSIATRQMRILLINLTSPILRSHLIRVSVSFHLQSSTQALYLSFPPSPFLPLIVALPAHHHLYAGGTSKEGNTPSPTAVLLTGRGREGDKARLHFTELSSPPQPSATVAIPVRRSRQHCQSTPLQSTGRRTPAEFVRRLAPPRNRGGHRWLCSVDDAAGLCCCRTEREREKTKAGGHCRCKLSRRRSLVTSFYPPKPKLIVALPAHHHLYAGGTSKEGNTPSPTAVLLTGRGREGDKARLHFTELSSPPQPSATVAIPVRRSRQHRQSTPLQSTGRRTPAEFARRLAPPRNRGGHRWLCSVDDAAGLCCCRTEREREKTKAGGHCRCKLSRRRSLVTSFYPPKPKSAAIT
nr:hypothetical protein Iba_chr04aCG17520 [Ipomoea batatas]